MLNMPLLGFVTRVEFSYMKFQYFSNLMDDSNHEHSLLKRFIRPGSKRIGMDLISSVTENKGNENLNDAGKPKC